MSEKWQRGTTIDVIYLFGESAELVLDEVKGAYPQVQLLRDA